MGLDMMAYWIKKNGTPAREQIMNWTYEEANEHELFYGRKSWEIVDALKCDLSDPDSISELQMDSWINLVESLSQISEQLDEISDAYRTLDDVSGNYDTFSELRKMYPREVKLTEVYEVWHKETFDEYPTLGYEFSTGYMQSIWEAVDKVTEYLENPDYEVWIYASY